MLYLGFILFSCNIVPAALISSFDILVPKCDYIIFWWHPNGNKVAIHNTWFIYLYFVINNLLAIFNWSIITYGKRERIFKNVLPSCWEQKSFPVTNFLESPSSARWLLHVYTNISKWHQPPAMITEQSDLFLCHWVEIIMKFFMS